MHGGQRIILRAVVYRQMNTPYLAVVIAAVSWAADPLQLEVHRTRAEALLAKMDFREALAEAQALNHASPDDVSGYRLMAAAQLELGDYDDAEKQLQWMLDLRIGKADAQGWLLVARFREVTGDVEGALDALNLAYPRLVPTDERGQQSLNDCAARLLYRAGKLDQAEQIIQRAGANPTPPLLETLARIRLAQGKREEAIELLRRLAKRDPHPRYLYLLAQTSGAAADYEAFETAALSATESPDNANQELALYYSGPGKQPAKALEIARREALRRRDVFTLDSLAVALFANRQTSEARSTMLGVLGVGTQDPSILAHAVEIGVRHP